MKRLVLLMLISICCRYQAFSQGINNKWFCFTNSVIDFSGSTPVLAVPPNFQSSPSYNSGFPGYYPGGWMGAQTAVCDANGNLLFFVKILNVGGGGLLGNVYPGWPKIFDRNGYSMPNSDINISWEDHTKQSLIVPCPGNPNLYYIFYTKNGGLQYSLVDMALNNGLGDVVPSEKDVLLSGWGTINGTQITAVPGCRGLWLIARSLTDNRYFSYLIDNAGIHPNPTISNSGLLPLNDYINIYFNDGVNWPVSYPGGRLVASQDGTHLAIGTKRGIEMYDFEKCSGKIGNPRLIDSMPYFGLCFSPDGSRLYASQVYPLPYNGQQGQVYQFDLIQSTTQNISDSKTLILSNPAVACYTAFTGCYCDTISSPIGDLKLGPNGQIYMANNLAMCADCLPVPPSTSVFRHHALHVIHDPNALGLACNPEVNVLELNTPPSFFGNNGAGECAGAYLSGNVISPPALPDTIAGTNIPITVCFKETKTLHADPNGSCYLWDDSSTAESRVVDTDGLYWVRYFKDCTVTTDTYQVHFIPLPEFSQLVYGCPGDISVQIINKSGDTTGHTYELKDAQGKTLDVQESHSEVVFNALDAETYSLRITTASGCDTSMDIELDDYPVPELTARPADTTIRYGDSVRLHAGGAYLYSWSPSNPLDTTVGPAPVALPKEPTVFTVIGWNRYGCKDTGYVRIHIDYRMPDLIPNAFSPNGDGLNDVFKVAGITYQKVEVFEIFNRYGQQIFSTMSPDAGWDGTYRGKPCDVGTYYYLIRLAYPNGTSRTFKGEINLIR